MTVTPILFRDGVSISRDTFFAGCARLADSLRTAPAGPVMPLCSSRRDLLAAVVAAQSVGRETILPPDDAARAVESVLDRYGSVLVLGSEGDAPVGGMPYRTVDSALFADRNGTDKLVADWRADARITLYTSGSTGAPEAHCHGHPFIVAGIQAWRDILDVAAGPVGLVVTVPGQHMFGFEASVILPLGEPSVAVLDSRPFYPADIAFGLESIPSRRRILILTPLHLHALVESGTALPPVDRAVVATAPLTRDLAVRGEQLLGAPVLEVYGSTETGMVATRRPAHDGHDFVPRGDTRVDVDNKGRAVAFGPHLGDGVVLNDRLERTETGFRLLARDQDIVKVAGKRASLVALNTELNALPMVREGTIVPADVWQDSVGAAARPAAVVVAESDVTAEQIRHALRTRIPSAFVPRRIVFVDALPRSRVGKVQLETLCEIIRSGGGERMPLDGETFSDRRFSVSPDHPSLAGHFPGDPIVPGVVALDLALATAEIDSKTTLKSVRFTSVLRPGESCSVARRDGPGGKATIECVSGARKILTAKVVLTGA